MTKEAEILFKLEIDYTVDIYNWWGYKNRLFIDMEYCPLSLQDVIKMKAQIFGRQVGQPMDCMEYYITCEIFKELLECVQYLHDLKPPVIHRDLKPDNILIAQNVNNNRFIKIADLGLYTFHERVTKIDENNKSKIHFAINKTPEYCHTTVVGTLKYMAPEVRIRANYTTKVDVHSLGVIALEIFDTDINLPR